MGIDYDEVSESERETALMEETPFFKEPHLAQHKQKYNLHYQFRYKLGLKLLEMIAIGLGKDRHFFNSWFEKEPLAILRTIRYPPRKESHVKDDKLSASDLKLI